MLSIFSSSRVGIERKSTTMVFRVKAEEPVAKYGQTDRQSDEICHPPPNKASVTKRKINTILQCNNAGVHYLKDFIS